MQTLNLKTKQTTEHDLSISIPFFSKSKDEKEWFAVFEDKTIVKFYTSGDYATIQRANLETESWYGDAIVQAHNSLHSCTESEFTQKYDEVIQSISKNTLLAV